VFSIGILAISMSYLASLLMYSSGNLPAAAAVGAAAGVYFFYRGFRLLQRRRLILNTPSSKIRSAAMGLVEVNGQAKGPHVIASPLKQTECFYYRSLAWEWRQRGKNSEWVKIAEETLHVPFYIDDGTGMLLIDPNGAEMDLHCDFRQEYGSLFNSAEMSAEVSQFLTRHGADFSKRIKVEEYCVQPEHFLFVLGTLAQNTGVSASIATPPQSATSAAAASAAVVAGHSRPLMDANGTPLVGANYRQIVHSLPNPTQQPATEMTQPQRVAAALVRAGITNPAAWAVAGVSTADATQVKPYSPQSGATTNAATESVRNAKFDPHPPAVLMKGTHDPTFLISWQSQKELLSSLGWKSALMIWGGPALTLVCVYFLLANFKLL